MVSFDQVPIQTWMKTNQSISSSLRSSTVGARALPLSDDEEAASASRLEESGTRSSFLEFCGSDSFSPSTWKDGLIPSYSSLDWSVSVGGLGSLLTG